MNSIVFLSPLCIQETEGEYFPFQVFIKKRAKRNDIVVSSVAGGKKLLLYSFFWVIPRRPNFMCRRFGACYLFHLQNMGQCSETSVHKIQTPGYHPKERIRHSQHGESLKSRNKLMFLNSEFRIEPTNPDFYCIHF